MSKGKVWVVDHPLVHDKLTILREKSTDIGNFRHAMSDMAYLLFYEATRGLPLLKVEIETPLQAMSSFRIKPDVVLVAILRAGLGFLDGVLQKVPFARVGYLGLKRDPATLKPSSYYQNLPKMTSEDRVFVFDPMLATGHTAVAGIQAMQEAGAKHIHLISLLASPVGIATVHKAFPEISITTAAIDAVLDERGYILPGLGDAGDRLYGTMDH